MMKIDKSLFNAEELAQYEALIAKAKVDPEKGEEETEDLKPPFPPKKKGNPEEEIDMEKKCKKSASPELTAALERLETLEKSIAMKEMEDVAKKYAPLGEKVEELAKSLYAMKSGSEDNYNAYIAVLDKSLGLVEKSGVFAEIGKSAGGVGGDVLSKVETAATEIQKSDATMTRAQAIAKAWEAHPEFVAEYDKEYQM